MIISPQMTTSIYSGVGGGQILPPNAVSGLLMWHDASVGGLTAVTSTVSDDLSTWTQNVASSNATATAVGDGTWVLTENAIAAQPSRHTIYALLDPSPSAASVTVYSCRVRRGSGTRNLSIRSGNWVRGAIYELAGAGSVVGLTTDDIATISLDSDGYYVCTWQSNGLAGSNYMALSLYSGTTESYSSDGTSTLIVRDVSATQSRYSAWANQVADTDYALGQSTVGSQPDYRSISALNTTNAINGYACPALRVDATYGKLMVVASAKTKTDRLHNAADSCTLITAWRPDIITTQYVVGNGNTNVSSNRGWNLRMNSATNGLIVRARVDSTTNALDFTAANGVLTAGQPIVVTYRKAAGTRPIATLRLNGVEVMAPTQWTADAYALTSSDTYRWGWRYDITSDISIMGDALYDSVLSDAIVAKLEQYWASRMGISF